jgi:uncharacterized SAM-binding protein YcdF (DUF218 family)
MEPFLMPPLSLLLAGGAGWLLRKSSPRLGRALMLGAVALLALLSTPLVSAFLLRALQSHPALDAAQLDHGCGAIVVLAGDAQLHAPEYGDASCGPLTLERLRYGARLARATKLPLLVSGGAPRAGVRSHAAMMKEALELDFGLEAKWIEERSANTRENLRHSSEMLREAGIARAYLVTHAWHMPRAVEWARSAGFDVVAAPTGFRAPADLRLATFLPSAKALRESAWALHEWFGRAWQLVAG